MAWRLIKHRRNFISNFPYFIPIPSQPCILLRDKSKRPFHAISHEQHTQIVNCKSSTLYTILHFIYPYKMSMLLYETRHTKTARSFATYYVLTVDSSLAQEPEIADLSFHRYIIYIYTHTHTHTERGDKTRKMEILWMFSIAKYRMFSGQKADCDEVYRSVKLIIFSLPMMLKYG
jgi:hypothetical protein